MPASGNVISGNTANGIALNSNYNVIAGNTIGLNAQGNAKLGNGGNGIGGAGSNNIIGSDAALQAGVAGANVISGNNYDGIYLSGAYNTIAGNYIGTDSTGAVAIGNSWNGIELSKGASGNAIGLAGISVGAPANVISGNGTSDANSVRVSGIYLTTVGANTIQGNYIGTDLAGSASLGNDGAGIFVVGANTGTTVVLSNVISANGVGKNFGPTQGYGIDVTGDAVVDIENNTVGFDTSQPTPKPLRNTAGGISPNVTNGDANGDTVKGNVVQ